jgi:hypothetical protein
MDSRRNDIHRGHKANDILDPDSIVVEALEELEKRYTNEWKTSKVDEVEKREKSFMAVMVLQDIRVQLQTYADRGKYAAKQLQKEQLQ